MQVPLLVDDFLRRPALLYPEKTAIVDGERRFSYRQYQARVNQLSHALRALGLEAGDRVCILSPNSHFFLESFYATSQIGVILVPLNYRLLAADHAYILAHSGVRAVLVDWEYTGVVDEIRDQLPAVEHWIVAQDAGDAPAGLDRLGAAHRGPAHRAPRSASAGRERRGLHQLHLGHHGATQGCDAHPPQLLRERLQPHRTPARGPRRRGALDPAHVPLQRLGRRLRPDRHGGHPRGAPRGVGARRSSSGSRARA